MRRCSPRQFSCALAATTFAAFDAVESQSVRDSAGIQIVENRAAGLGASRAWRIDPQPIVTIGGQTADRDTLNELNLVMGITRLSDGRYAVGVQASNAVRFYDARGKYLGFAGRRGEGPGEFQQIMGVRALKGDTLFVTDLGEVELFAPNGRFARQGATRARADRFIYPSVVFSDGSYLGAARDDPAVPAAGQRRQQWPLVKVSPDGSKQTTVATMLSPEQKFDGRYPFGTMLVFSESSQLAGGSERFFISCPIEGEIDEYDLAGQRVRRIRLPNRNERPSDQAIREYREYVMASPGENGRPMPPAMKARFAEMLEKATYAARFPSIGRLLVDKVGNLWIQRYDYHSVFRTPGPVRTQTMTVASRWDVVDANGRWITTVDLPARFTPVEIGADYVAGLARDEDEVEQVRIYRLRKPDTP